MNDLKMDIADCVPVKQWPATRVQKGQRLQVTRPQRDMKLSECAVLAKQPVSEGRIQPVISWRQI